MTKKHKLSERDIYLSGILAEMRSVQEMIDLKEAGRCNFDSDIYLRNQALREELEKVRHCNNIEVVIN